MKRMILILVICLLIVACSEKKQDGPKAGSPVSAEALKPFNPTGTDEEQVKQTVNRYNVLLADGYRTLNMNRIAEVATQDQAEKAYVHMAAIGEGQVRMVSNLKQLDFTRVERQQPDAYVVKTREVWDFAYTDIKTGKEAEREKDFVYEMTYTLKKDGPRWIIHDIVAYAPQDREEKRAPRVIRPKGEKPAASPAMPPGHVKVGQ